MTGEILQDPRPSAARSITVETERLRLRLVSLEDRAALQALMTAGISRWVATWPHPLDSATAGAIIGQSLLDADEGRCLPLVIVERSTERIVGWIRLGIHEAGPERSGELGYWIGEASQGQGYALEAARGVLTMAFSTLDLAWIEAGAQPANAISHRVLEKLGMHPVGERPVYAPARQRWGTCFFWRVDRRGGALVRG